MVRKLNIQAPRQNIERTMKLIKIKRSFSISCQITNLKYNLFMALKYDKNMNDSKSCTRSQDTEFKCYDTKIYYVTGPIHRAFGQYTLPKYWQHWLGQLCKKLLQQPLKQLRLNQWQPLQRQVSLSKPSCRLMPAQSHIMLSRSPGLTSTKE